MYGEFLVNMVDNGEKWEIFLEIPTMHFIYFQPCCFCVFIKYFF